MGLTATLFFMIPASLSDIKKKIHIGSIVEVDQSNNFNCDFNLNYPKILRAVFCVKCIYTVIHEQMTTNVTQFHKLANSALAE